MPPKKKVVGTSGCQDTDKGADKDGEDGVGTKKGTGAGAGRKKNAATRRPSVQSTPSSHENDVEQKKEERGEETRDQGDHGDHDERVSANDFRTTTWKLMNMYFRENGAYTIVKHQIDSYNDFVLRKLDHIIEGFNPIEIHHIFIPDLRVFQYILSVRIENPVLARPMMNEKDGRTKVMMPNDARLRNLTYAAALTVDVNVQSRTFDADSGEYVCESKKLTGVSLGKIPIMVRSRYCMLSQPCASVARDTDECRNDYGGYFIINGNEKVVVSQDRIAENKTYVFLSQKMSMYSYVAEVRSVAENRFGVPKTTTLKLTSKSTQFGRHIRVNMHHIKHDIPLFILFRAMGVESDREIVRLVVHDMEDPVGKLVAQALVGCMDEASSVTCTRDALDYLSKYLHAHGHPRELSNDPSYRVSILRGVLAKEFLPHAGGGMAGKALYLGYMANKLLRCFLGVWELDDRDSYINKRLDTPGVCLANLFRSHFGKVAKDMRNMLQKEVHGGAWRTSHKFINVIHKHNVFKIIKSTVIESGLKYGLATGNWGMKSARMRQGVAQVLNRLTYMATLSHLRRVNTPIEKTGKLVQPRKLHSTQWGVICPSETPEGSSIGLVKNLAMTCTVTVAAVADHLRRVLPSLGMIPFPSGEASCASFDLSMFGRGTKVIVNGDIVGVHFEPQLLHDRLRGMKRSGEISVYSSVAWYVMRNEICVSTEGGRCVRPLYIVDPDNVLRFDRRLVRDVAIGRVRTWTDLVIEQPDRRAIVEYVDVDEANCGMVAVSMNDLAGPSARDNGEGDGRRGGGGGGLADRRVMESRERRRREWELHPPDHTEAIETVWGREMEMNRSLIAGGIAAATPKFSHLEIDPSLILGAMAGSIPFSDHNQAPRNTYQCLWEEEPVLLAYGRGYRAIKDLRVGDVVVGFDPSTMKTSATRVTHHVVGPTDKPMLRVNTCSGRSIHVTDDHLFMSHEIGWIAARDIVPGQTRVAVYAPPLGPNCDDHRALFSAIECSDPLTIIVPSSTGVGEHDGCMLFVRVSEIVPVTGRSKISDITVESTDHTFVGGDGFGVHNSAMGKQAMGLFATNFRHRYDTMSYTLNYPQRPLVSTQIARIINCNKALCGINAVVAIATCTGFNQEDSVIINESAVDRGMFVSTFYRTFREQRNKNHSSGEEEVFCRPDPRNTKGMKPFNYGKLNDDGFVPEDTPVEAGDVIIGRCMPQKVGNSIQFKDTSVVLKNNDRGSSIDRNAYGNKYFINTNGDGYGFGKVRTRTERVPTIGDKFSCYSPDHELLTSTGWVGVADITFAHRLATLVGERLVYQRPTELQCYEYSGPMFRLLHGRVDLLVTPNHRVYAAHGPDPCVDTSFETVEARHLHLDRFVMRTSRGNGDFDDVDDEDVPPHCFVDGVPAWVWRIRDRSILRDAVLHILSTLVVVRDRPQDSRSTTFMCPRRSADAFQHLCLHAGMSCTLSDDPSSAGDDESRRHSPMLLLRVWSHPSTQEVEFLSDDHQWRWSWDDYEGRVHCCTVPEGDGVVYVRRGGKAVWCGQSRHGQKGTMGMMYKQHDMPFTSSGIVPDIIVNPHAIPSRMTIGQLMECIMGKACSGLGAYGDATPFTDVSVEDIARQVEACGMERYGNELMYNSRTGEQVKVAIFMGPTYYQRLKHMVEDKLHSRSNNGPVVLLTRQPAEGRARDGGLRLGEMEIECNWAHGIMHFLKERFMECSDNYRVFVCKKCGMMATVNPDRDIYKCVPCKNVTDFTEVRIPYACKLLFQEIQTMGIGTRLLT